MNDSNDQDNRHRPSDDELDPQLQALFANNHQNSGDAVFTERVMPQVDRLRRRKFMMRAILAMIVATFAVPFKDGALALSQVMIVSLIELEAGLVAELLAPINSVGGVLSIVLLILRATHKRLFN